MTIRSQIGFIGLGQMGRPMAERLLHDDIQLHVCEPDADTARDFAARGATVHPSARAVADEATIVFACLPNQNISKAVAFGDEGVIHGTAVRLYIETSTIGHDCIAEIESVLGKKGIGVVDSPVTGGPPAAREGRLAIIGSGAAPHVRTAMPFLDRIGGRTFVVGEEVGQAQTAKLINNLIMAANMATAAEGLAFGVRAGLDPILLAEIVCSGSGRSVALSDIIAPFALNGGFDFGGRVTVVDKDARLGLAQARSVDVDMPVIAQAGDVWARMVRDGHGAEDISAIIHSVRDHAGAVIWPQ